jgi:hypothetical protein
MELQDFCNALDHWATLRGKNDDKFQEAWQYVRLQIRKSNLLYRTLVLKEPICTIPCPIHHGRWSGSGPDPGCGCWLPGDNPRFNGDITGWLKQPAR